uniref:Putative nuclease HARBI1 isoform X2 n=1 Tax=Davidia involucrata TaxID=16924 RepID=A0A5B7BNX5_DAVIN
MLVTQMVKVFLVPFRNQLYHLSLWRNGPAPTNSEEFFNLNHSAACNVIERCFGLLKLRWAVLRSPSFFPIKSQNRIVTPCCLVHNLIRREMPVDPIEDQLEDTLPHPEIEGDLIDIIDTSNQWTKWRNNLAQQMYADWLANRGY